MIAVQQYFIDKLTFLKLSASRGGALRIQTQEYVNKELPSHIRSKSNIFNTMLSVILDITNVFYAVVATSAKESNINVAERPTSVRGLAQIGGHTATRPISARGVVSITQKKTGISSEGIVFNITNGTRFRCLETNLIYTADTNDTLTYHTSNSNYYVKLIEGERKSTRFVADGTPFYTAHLDDQNAIENYDIGVRVNGVPYTRADCIADMFAGKLQYVLTNGFNNQVDVTFGDNTHGVLMEEGDVIDLFYVVTNGEYGNASESAQFEIVGGLTDVSGNEADITQYVAISRQSGFDLGSNGEHITMTRRMAGFSSRSLTFPRPENLEVYLSRLSILSNVRVSNNINDDRIFNITALPNLAISKPTDYFHISESKMLLSIAQKDSIKEMINASRRQMVSSEVVFVDPVIKKYGVFVYADANIYDKDEFKNRVLTEIANIMASKTFSPDAITTIAKSHIQNPINDMNDVSRVSIQLFSNENETAKAQGFYTKVTPKVVSGKTTFETEKIIVTEDPNLGFSDIGDISVSEMQVPIIRGGWDIDLSGTKFTLNSSGVHVFVFSQTEGWNEI